LDLTFKDLLNPESFDSTEFIILQIRIVNEFGPSKQSSVADLYPVAGLPGREIEE
jgi:hypothetical protein